MKIKAIQIHANGGPEVLRFEDVELPPPGAGEVCVRHTAISLNFSDINVRRGGFYIAEPLKFPVILGNEGAGRGTVIGGHGICVDSQGGIYVTEIGQGQRVSKFVRV
ncbi:MAG: hypothetical protein QGF09_14075 [Rhodospirillales bacterium]|nr:hypothetical protein [Rhodospirillales bacterium]